MEGNKSISVFFLIGIVLSSLIISPYVLDFTLVSRFILLAFFLMISFFLCFKKEVVSSVKIDLPVASYILYTAVRCCSILWANTTSEALFAVSYTHLDVYKRQGIQIIVTIEI